MIQNLSFSWGKIDHNIAKKNQSEKIDNRVSVESLFEGECILNDISLHIKKAEFVGVFGEVGSGKSSLIHAILNNLLTIDDVKSNEIFVNGTVAYSAQNPWIKSDTIRNNILFHSEYDKIKYKETLEYCQLVRDLDIMPFRDETEISENATNISGGQKSRISLARAIYQNKNIYLLDDPLAALDTEVADKIFFDCISKYLKSSTRIFATHNIKYLPYFDRIIWLNRGEIVYNGPFSELIKVEFFIDFLQELQSINSSRTGIKVNNNMIHPENILNKISGSYKLVDIEKEKEESKVFEEKKVLDTCIKGKNNVKSNKSNLSLMSFSLRRKSILSKKVIDPGNYPLQPIERRKSILSIKFIENIKTNSINDENCNIQENLEKNYYDCNIENKPKTKKLKSNLSIRFITQKQNNDDNISNINYINNKEKEDGCDKKDYIENNHDKKNNHCLSTNWNKTYSQKKINIIDNNQIISPKQKLINPEKQEVGEIKIHVFITYFKYIGGLRMFLLIVLSIVLWQVLNILSNFCITNWKTVIENQTKENKDNSYYILSYSILALASCFFMFLRLFYSSQGNLYCAEILHNEMISNIIKAPINLFHDITNQGELFNKLSKDLDNLFNSINKFGKMLVVLFTCVGSIFTITLYVKSLLIVIPLLVKFGLSLYRYFISANRDLRRLEGVSRSQISIIVSETFDGLIPCIRVFNKEQKYKQLFYNIIDNNMKINLFINGCLCWFGLYLELIGLLFFALILLCIILFQDSFSAKAIGLMIIYSAKLQHHIIQIFFAYNDFESDMISMERCLSLVVDVPKEKEETKERDGFLLHHRSSEKTKSNNINKDQKIKICNNKNKFFKFWPEKGEIKFINYSVKYRPDSPTVIDNITLTIKPGEKIGIIGRTGSGKSTICNSLLRILEPLSGTIIIDGEDITKIGLRKLRKSITIILQEPCLFKGSLRYNIDPLNEYDDKEISNALDLIDYNYKNDEKGINKEMGNGNYISIGEKQMISIVRAILRVNSYLLINLSLI